jgi:flagellar hook assembly protein FlgD
VVAPGNTISSTGAASVWVEGIDDPSVEGWMAVPDLLPRDSAPPAVWGIDTGLGVFSPNGDGRFDDAAVSGRFSEVVDWRARVLDGDTVLDEVTGSGDDFSIGWDGLDGGDALPDGDYDVEIEAQDAWGNGPTTKTTSLKIDTTPAELGAVSPEADVDRWIAPNGDLSRETLAWTAAMTEPGSLVLHVYDGDGQRVRIFAQTSATGSNTLTWDGKDDDGDVVPDGTYEVRVTPRDRTGTSGAAAIRSVRVDTMLGFVDNSRILFYPHDGDTLAPTTTLGYTLTRAATVTWVIKDASGAVVDTLLDAVPTEPGAYTHVYDGTRSDLPRLATGYYTSEVTATDGVTTVVQARGFRMMAFYIVPTDSTPKRGQKISVTVTTAEPLKTTPRLFVYQPGKSRWGAVFTKTSSTTYKVTITLKTGGSAGTVKLKAFADDSQGHLQSTTLAVVSH